MFRGVSPGGRVWDSISSGRLLPLRLGWRGGSASATEGESLGGRQGELLTVLLLLSWLTRRLHTLPSRVSVVKATAESSANYIYFSRLALANVSFHGARKSQKNEGVHSLNTL